MQSIDRLSHVHPDEELIQALEPDQLVSQTSKPLPRYPLSTVADATFMSAADISSLNDSARRLHFRQGAALASRSVDPNGDDRLRLSVNIIFGSGAAADRL